MEPLVRFVTLIAAILVIPWLAAQAPDWSKWDSGWVQAWGSIGAILVGFGYVALQHRWQQAALQKDRFEVRYHAISVALSIQSEIEKQVALVEKWCREGKGMKRIHSVNGMNNISAELMALSPHDCGSGKFSTYARQVGLFAQHFAATMDRISDADAPIAEDDLEKLRECHSTLSEGANAMRNVHEQGVL